MRSRIKRERESRKKGTDARKDEIERHVETRETGVQAGTGLVGTYCKSTPPLSRVGSEG